MSIVFWFCSLDLFQETGVDIGLSPETNTVSAQDPFRGQGGKYYS